MKQNTIDDSFSNVEPVPAVLLVGGMGTRLRSVVPSTPKPLAPVGRKSFLELLVRQLRHQGIRRLVMCTGYLADQIEEEFKDGRLSDIRIEYSKEPCPLGTAGAIKLAQSHLVDSPSFLVMNGDSFLEADFHRLIQFHRTQGSMATIAALQVTNGARYGRIYVDTDGKVTAFEEKTGNPGAGLVSAGIYVFDRAIFNHIPEGPSSLEKDIFPRLLGHGVYALEQKGMFIDIGTPDDYTRAQELCDRLYGIALDAQYSKYRDSRIDKGLTPR